MEKEFHLNENGVCMNPNVQSIVSGKFRAMIKTAKIDGKWYCAHSFDTPTGGWSCGVTKDKREEFNTEHEAISCVARKGIKWFKDEIEWYAKGGKVLNVPEFIFDELENLTKHHPVQLELFDL